MAHDFRMLTRFSAWANEKLFDAVSTLDDEIVHGKRAGRSNTLIGVLGHIYVVDLIWKANLEGQAHGFTSRKLETPMSLTALRLANRASDQWYVDFADAATNASLDEVVNFQFVDGKAGSMRRADMLLHIINHRTYHRGYVADMLYESGAKPPTMDLPVYLRDAA
jgi:uncharacterized damage-inducible protein DinB